MRPDEIDERVGREAASGWEMMMLEPLPSIEPQNGLSKTIAAVQWTIGSCLNWQNWTGTVGVVAAVAKVHLFAFPVASSSNGYTQTELGSLRPGIALTYIPPADLRTNQSNYRRMRSASGGAFSEQATVYAHVFDTVNPDISHDTAAVLMTFTNKLGGLIDELLTLEDVDNCCYVQAVSLAIEPHRASEVIRNTQGDFVQAMLRIDVGVGA